MKTAGISNDYKSQKWMKAQFKGTTKKKNYRNGGLAGEMSYIHVVRGRSHKHSKISLGEREYKYCVARRGEVDAITHSDIYIIGFSGNSKTTECVSAK